MTNFSDFTSLLNVCSIFLRQVPKETEEAVEMAKLMLGYSDELPALALVPVISKSFFEWISALNFGLTKCVGVIEGQVILSKTFLGK